MKTRLICSWVLFIVLGISLMHMLIDLLHYLSSVLHEPLLPVVAVALVGSIIAVQVPIIITRALIPTYIVVWTSAAGERRYYNVEINKFTYTRHTATIYTHYEIAEVAASNFYIGHEGIDKYEVEHLFDLFKKTEK